MKEKKKRMRSILTEDFFENQETNNEAKETPKDRISEEPNISEDKVFKETEQADREITSEPDLEREFHKQSIEEILSGTGLPTPEEFFKEQDEKNAKKEEPKKKRSFFNHGKEKQLKEAKPLFDNYETENKPAAPNEKKEVIQDDTPYINKKDISYKTEDKEIADTQVEPIENAQEKAFNNTGNILSEKIALQKTKSNFPESNSEEILNAEEDTQSKSEENIQENKNNNANHTIYNEESNMLSEKDIKEEVNRENIKVQENNEPKDDKTLLKERLERELQEKINRRNQNKQIKELDFKEETDAEREAIKPQLASVQNNILKEQNDTHSVTNDANIDRKNNETVKERLERELREKIAKRDKATEAEVSAAIKTEDIKQEKTEISTADRNANETDIAKESQISGAMVIGSMVLGSSAIQTAKAPKDTAYQEENDNKYNEQKQLPAVKENIDINENPVSVESFQGRKSTDEDGTEDKQSLNEYAQKIEDIKDEKALLKDRLERELREKIQKRNQKELTEVAEIQIPQKHESAKVIEDIYEINEEKLPQDEQTLNTLKQEELTHNNDRSSNDTVIDKAVKSDENEVINKPLKREEDKSKEEKEQEDKLREREELERELLRKIEENDKAQELKQPPKEPTDENKNTKNLFKSWFKTGKNEKNEEQKEQPKENTQLIDKEESPKDDKGKFLDVLAKYSK